MSKTSDKKSEVAASFAWSALENGFAQISQISVFFIIARLLTPEEVGSASLALIVVQAFQSIVVIGITGFIISSDNKSFLSSYSQGHYLSLIMGFIQLAVIVSALSLISLVYGFSFDYLLYLICATSNLAISFGISRQAALTRALMMKSLALRTVISVTVSGILSIYLAYEGFGSFAIVTQSLMQSIIATLLLRRFSTDTVFIAFDFEKLKEITRFIRHPILTGSINFGVANADLIIVGAYLGPHIAGIYAVARRALFAARALVTTAIYQVSLSVFAKFSRESEAELNDNLFRLLRATSLIVIPIFFIISGISEPLILLLFGERWIGASMVMAILMPAGALQSLGMLNQSYSLARRRADLQTRFSIADAVVSIPLLMLLTPFGIMFAAIGYTFANYIIFPVSVAMVTRITDITFISYMRTIVLGFFFSVICLISSYVFQKNFEGPFVKVLAGGSAGVMVYCFLVAVFVRRPAMNLLLSAGKILLRKNRQYS